MGRNKDNEIPREMAKRKHQRTRGSKKEEGRDLQKEEDKRNV